MKKIVALVLSLVMVLGLATVAFGAQKQTTYEGLYAKYANDTDITGTLKLTVTEGKAPVYDKTTGAQTAGEIEYGMLAGSNVTYDLVNSLADLTADADVVLYKDAAKKVPVFFLKAVDTVEYLEAAVFTNFGEDCGEFNYADYDKDSVYYTVKGDENVNVYEASATGDKVLKVGSEFVTVDSTAVADVTDEVDHTAIYEIKNGKTLSIECGVCGAKAVQVANKLSMPKGADVVTGEDTWYWPVAGSVVTDGDTVESAKTFDAGIAMYVGMSVMAAAGSAVVLKKKD